MSNSIWKTPGFHEAIDNKLKVSKDGKWIYWTMYGWNIPGEDVHDIGVEWAYVEDVLTQADKAERLEKENEAMRVEFEVWHGNYKCEIEEKKQLQKDLEIARKALEDARILADTRCIASAVKTIDKALEKIEHKEK